MALVSIRQAAKAGVLRLREPKWANKMDHIKIDVLQGGEPGPWIRLYSPTNKGLGNDDPMMVLGLMLGEPGRPVYDEEEFEPYEGPLPESDEYKAAVALYL